MQAGALSNEAFPFKDIWPAVTDIVEKFGPQWVMWGTDYNRTRPLLSYEEAVQVLSGGREREAGQALVQPDYEPEDGRHHFSGR